MAALTASPSVLSTGTDSPVRADSFTAVLPLRMMPSTGMLPPGRTTNSSPFLTSSTGISVSLPPRSTMAVFGERFIRERRASVVLPLLLASSILPTVMSVRIMAADSK